jgi:hypothetical protein
MKAATCHDGHVGWHYLDMCFTVFSVRGNVLKEGKMRLRSQVQLLRRQDGLTYDIAVVLNCLEPSGYKCSSIDRLDFVMEVHYVFCEELNF